MTERKVESDPLVAIATNDGSRDPKSRTSPEEEGKYRIQEDSYGSCGFFGEYHGFKSINP